MHFERAVSLPYEKIEAFGSNRIVHGFFGRRGGVSHGEYNSLNLGLGSKDYGDSVLENRNRVCKVIGAERLYSCFQEHGCNAVVVEKETMDRVVADIMVTKECNVALCVLTADCVPVLFADVDARIVAAAHAGWRGAVGGVVEEALDVIEKIGGSRERVQAVIGPCIQKCSYEVGADFRDEVLTTTAWADELFELKRPEKWNFDLPKYVAMRLERSFCGSVVSVPHDTYSLEKQYFSNRRQNKRGDLDYGRNGSVVMLKN